MVRVDTDDLIDSHGVAEILGLAQSTSVSNYTSRYDDFPQPVVRLGRGRCRLWRRSDVEKWVKARTRRRRH